MRGNIISPLLISHFGIFLFWYCSTRLNCTTPAMASEVPVVRPFPVARTASLSTPFTAPTWCSSRWIPFTAEVVRSWDSLDPKFTSCQPSECQTPGFQCLTFSPGYCPYGHEAATTGSTTVSSSLVTTVRCCRRYGLSRHLARRMHGDTLPTAALSSRQAEQTVMSVVELLQGIFRL